MATALTKQKTKPDCNISVCKNKFKMNIKPAFSFNIDMKLSEKGVAVGKYDGQNASLTAITQSNKVLEFRLLPFFINIKLSDNHSQPTSQV